MEAMVILPDHLHAIWTLPEGDDDFSLRWRQIKSAFSRQIEAGERVSLSRAGKQNGASTQGHKWQRRFWEHAIRNDYDYERHVDYIHFNPVKHGYVQSVADWPYSTFHRYVEIGLYPQNWAGGT